ncbi:MAG: DUF2914 domain-containing protein [Balneolaceae bacterium]|nr:MAG: DUF2914 domain-containing protein [Balneolaceae bacterium]
MRRSRPTVEYGEKQKNLLLEGIMLRYLLPTAILTLIMPLLFINTTAQAQEMTASVEVIEFLLCEDVEDREPVNPKEEFTTADERVYAYARIHNPEEPVNLYFRWTHDGAVYANISLLIGVSEAWRTYTSVQIIAGEWKVELVGEDEQVLASAEFSVSLPE